MLFLYDSKIMAQWREENKTQKNLKISNAGQWEVFEVTIEEIYGNIINKSKFKINNQYRTHFFLP